MLFSQKKKHCKGGLRFQMKVIYLFLSINLNAISELERQLQNVADDRKIVKEGPVNALER